MRPSCVLIILTVLISGCFPDYSPPQPPTDEELIQIFNDNKTVFVQLQAEIYKDGYSVVSLDPEWSRPEDIPLEAKKDYYELLRKVNVSQIRKTEKKSVIFVVWSTGNVSGGDSKGYIFRPSVDWPYTEKESLDNISQNGEEFFYKRKIDEDWYLYYDRFL